MRLHHSAPGFLAFSLLLRGAAGSAPSGPWDSFNFAPKTRVVRPTAVNKLSGSVQNAKNLISSSGKATLSNGSWVALDFGKEVCFVFCLQKFCVVLTPFA